MQTFKYYILLNFFSILCKGSYIHIQNIFWSYPPTDSTLQLIDSPNNLLVTSVPLQKYNPLNPISAFSFSWPFSQWQDLESPTHSMVRHLNGLVWLGPSCSGFKHQQWLHVHLKAFLPILQILESLCSILQDIPQALATYQFGITYPKSEYII